LLEAIEHLRGTTTTVGVLWIDLDRFQLVNQTLGNAAGDALLREVALRISAAIRHTDTAARLAGDEFAVLVDELCDADAAAVVAANVLGAFEEPFVVGGRELFVAPSIGIALFLVHATSVDGVLKCADAAMRAAKHAGGACYRMYESTMTTGTRKHLELESRLRRALARNEFRLAFQPIMDAATERVVGIETLLRLKAAESESASPAQFIPLLEQMGLIAAVGEWVLREACRQGVQWINAGGSPLIMSVNVSPRQLQDTGFVNMVANALEETAFPAPQLQLEVTEGMIMDASEQVLERIEQLASLGVRVAVDDFGTGYSSLAYLKRFRLHGLKIDRTFVRDMDTERDAAAIVEAVTSLARHLGLVVTAEGVENRNQLRMLRDYGCDCVQGFLLGKPLPQSEITKLIALQASTQLGEREQGSAAALAIEHAA
jgi:diguanylate cyclase (GGDEF)-like protein